MISSILTFLAIIILAAINYRNKQKMLVERRSILQIEMIKTSLEAKEETMKKLAERIHGDIQQTLSLAKLNLSRALSQQTEIDRARVERSKELIARTILEVKDLSKELDPKYITRYTLEENITRQLNQVGRRTDLVTDFRTSKEEIQTNEEILIFTYRIVQEAINNILAHADATQAVVILEGFASHFTLRIEDNGQGFEVDTLQKNTSRGIGLINMENRTKLLDGTFQITSAKGKGTIINLTIPYHGQKQEN